MSQLKSKPFKRKRKSDKPGFSSKEDNCLFDEEPPSKLAKKAKVANLSEDQRPTVKFSDESRKFYNTV
jgi:hypothetical protein